MSQGASPAARRVAMMSPFSIGVTVPWLRALPVSPAGARP